MNDSIQKKISFRTDYKTLPIILVIVCLLFGTLGITLAAQQSTQSIVATVKRAGANLRQGPGLQYERLGISRPRAVLPVVGQYTNDLGEVWYKVYVAAFGDVWVASWVVRVNVIQTSIPVTSLTTADASPPAASSPDIIITAMPSNITNSGGGNNPPPPQTTPDP